jgi:hypothetical protein
LRRYRHRTSAHPSSPQIDRPRSSRVLTTV